jgi:virulence-associated protein VapD
MNFFEYKDFNDFISRMGFTTDQGIDYLNKELEKRGNIL